MAPRISGFQIYSPKFLVGGCVTLTPGLKLSIYSQRNSLGQLTPLIHHHSSDLFCLTYCGNMFGGGGGDDVALMPWNGRTQRNGLDTDAIPLCNRCLQFDIQSFAKAPEGRRGYTLTSIEEGAREGCEFCSLLKQCVHELPGEEWEQHKEPYIHMSLWENDTRRINKSSRHSGLCANRLKLWVGGHYTVKQKESEIDVCKGEICLAAESGSAAASSNDITGRFLGHDPASEEHFDTVRRWLQECTKHERCNSDIATGAKIDHRDVRLPARCIYVSLDPVGICLVETEGKRGAYITLSHRWNEATERCKTITANYNRRLDGMFDELPPLFQNIFLIAQKLGIQYVWIDSLCIIQDDVTDWKSEGPKMAQYYQLSTLTVAGTEPSRELGLFKEFADDYQPWSCLTRLPYRDSNGQIDGWFYVYRRKTLLHDEYEKTIKNSKILQRGWIVQEWILSRRLLWYTPVGIYFECQELPARTAFQEQLDTDHKNDQNVRLELKSSFDFSHGDSFDHWYRMVELYAPTFLTNVDEDRLFALSSLTRAIREKLQRLHQKGTNEESDLVGAYCAGLWLQDIHRGLLWMMTGKSNATPKLENAASWSWISFVTNIRWPVRAKDYQRKFKITGLCTSRREAHNTPQIATQGQCPNLQILKATGQAASAHDLVDKGSSLSVLLNTMTCLHITGKISDVHVRGYLYDHQLEDIADMTGFDSTGGEHRWRAVCSQADPGRVAGWGSLEQLDGDTWCADSAHLVTCLVVSTRKVSVVGHRGWVIDVLFLGQAKNGQYCRLGVGAIFDPPLIEEISKTKQHSVQLV
jgi:hypothetical protein